MVARNGAEYIIMTPKNKMPNNDEEKTNVTLVQYIVPTARSCFMFAKVICLFLATFLGMKGSKKAKILKI